MSKNELIDRILFNIEHKTSLSGVLASLTQASMSSMRQIVKQLRAIWPRLVYTREILDHVTDPHVLEESSTTSGLFLQHSFDKTCLALLARVYEHRLEFKLVEHLLRKTAAPHSHLQLNKRLSSSQANNSTIDEETRNEMIADVVRHLIFLIGYACLASAEFAVQLQASGGVRVLLGLFLSDVKFVQQSVADLPARTTSSAISADCEEEEGGGGGGGGGGVFKDLVYICDILGWSSSHVRVDGSEEQEVLIKINLAVIDTLVNNTPANSNSDILTVIIFFFTFLNLWASITKKCHKLRKGTLLKN
jgi:hypothetical protein